MRKYLTELIGTFFLVFTICSASLAGGDLLAPLAIGSILMVMVYAGGHVSGAHYNPAVSLAAFIRGRLGLVDMLVYMGAQVAGGILAAMLSLYMFEDVQAFEVTGSKDITAAFIVELLFTFALAYVVLNVATSKDHPNNSFYGLAIGFTVFAGAVSVGAISGGAFNPAVGIGVAMAGLTSWSMLWIYLAAPLLGGALAGVVFRVQNPSDN